MDVCIKNVCEVKTTAIVGEGGEHTILHVSHYSRRDTVPGLVRNWELTGVQQRHPGWSEAAGSASPLRALQMALCVRVTQGPCSNADSDAAARAVGRSSMATQNVILTLVYRACSELQRSTLSSRRGQKLLKDQRTPFCPWHSIPVCSAWCLPGKVPCVLLHAFKALQRCFIPHPDKAWIKMLRIQPLVLVCKLHFPNLRIFRNPLIKSSSLIPQRQSHRKESQ